MTKEYKDTEKGIKSDKHAVKAVVKNVENRRSRSTKRAIVSLFPDQDPGSKAGVADAHMKDADAHVIQTPGKDKTIVDVKAGDMDAKVNLPRTPLLPSRMPPSPLPMAPLPSLMPDPRMRVINCSRETVSHSVARRVPSMVSSTMARVVLKVWRYVQSFLISFKLQP